MKLNKDDKLEVSNGCLKVNGKPFVVDFPDEPMFDVDTDGKLMTWFRGHLCNFWRPEEIEGYFA